MTGPERQVVWYPMRGRRWPDRHWVACDTWFGRDRMFARIAPAGSSDRPPILMLHGLVVSGAYFRPVARYLDSHYRLYIPDLPGYGQSATGATLELERLVYQLDAWMEAHGLMGAVVVGNSLGCQVATLLAVRFPHRVSSLVMVAPTVDPAARGPLGLMVRGVRDIPRERQSLWSIWIPDFFTLGPVRSLKSLLTSVRDPQLDRLPRVRQPVLAVAGVRDPISPVSWVEEFAAIVANGQATVIPNAAHAMNYSAPEALARIITEHVERAHVTGKRT